ncbi:MAG TPA: YdbH domain-containing protein [Rheinheimera sp.]|nr:YdbH domain-containing protein [Rheinheimera sp.]
MRWWHKTLLTGLVLLLLLTAGAYWYLQKTLAALPIQSLQFDLKAISLHQLQLRDVSFRLAGPQLHVELQQVTLRWHFPSVLRPALQQLSLDGGNIKLQQWPQADTTAQQTHDTAFSLPQNWQLPAALPPQLDIRQLRLSLPCADKQCDYMLSARMTAAQQQWRFQLQGSDTQSADITRFSLNGNYQTVQGLPLLNLQLSVDNSVALTLQQTLIQQSGLQATGELTVNIAPPSPWLLQQFNAWQLELPPDAIARFTAPVTLSSHWSFNLPAAPDLASIREHANGNWHLSANLPAPLSVPGIGQLQGQLQAELGLDAGELSKYQLKGELSLLQPQIPEALRQQGIAANAVQINLSADGKGKPQLTALPLALQLRTEGPTELNFTADASVNLTPPLSASMRNATLTLSQPELTAITQTKLQQLRLQSRFHAYWLADSWQLDILSATADMEKVSAADVSADAVKLQLSASQISGDSAFTTLRFQTEMLLQAAEVRQAQLKPQSWQWLGKLNGKLDSTPQNTVAVQAEGKLSNHAGLGLSHQLKYQPQQLRLNWQLDDTFFLAGNPLAASLTAWPALLEFNRGRIAASGTLHITDAIAAQANISLSGVSGIYDRSVFKELSAPLTLVYQGDDVTLSTTEASLGEIQHGIVAGPLQLSAGYVAPANTPTAGKLNIQQLQLHAMGGTVKVQPVALDLALQQQELILQLQQIDLSQLLQQHPTTDLTGNGRISGTIPLLLSRSGASVEDGYIAAESPGGKLQYRPPAAQNMAATNPGMQVMLQALDDFHYSVLSSNVSYDTNGKLLLALKLHGSNPALEAGRPINLNINLEEDIPALITSLQLSSQISDKIKQRVQQRLQQSGAKTGANGAQP